MIKKLCITTLFLAALTVGTMFILPMYNKIGYKGTLQDSPVEATSAEATSPPAVEASKSADAVIDNSRKVHEVSFLSAGDILFHMPEVVSAQENGSYNFKPMFSDVKSAICSKDISVANFETTVNPKKPLSGYPSFNTPVQALEALKDTGFQILINDHNHTLDTGLDGLRSTNKLIKDYGFAVLGSGEPQEDKSLVVEKNGIKVGMLSYTYGTNYGVQYKDMINYIDEVRIRDDINKIRPNCDFLIVFLHLGTEYVRTVEPFQADIVNKTAKFGADAILCSHPHVAKKTEMLSVGDRKVLVNYSMGNFISNQNDKYTDIGSMESLIIEKRGPVTRLRSAETIPVYRLRYDSGGKVVYKTVPSESTAKYGSIIGQSTLTYINQVSKELSFKYSAPWLLPLENNVTMYTSEIN